MSDSNTTDPKIDIKAVSQSPSHQAANTSKARLSLAIRCHWILISLIFAYEFIILLILMINYTPKTQIERGILNRIPIVAMIQTLNIGIGYLVVATGVYNAKVGSPRAVWLLFSVQVTILVYCVLAQVSPSGS